MPVHFGHHVADDLHAASPPRHPDHSRQPPSRPSASGFVRVNTPSGPAHAHVHRVSHRGRVDRVGEQSSSPSRTAFADTSDERKSDSIQSVHALSCVLRLVHDRPHPPSGESSSPRASARWRSGSQLLCRPQAGIRLDDAGRAARYPAARLLRLAHRLMSTVPLTERRARSLLVQRLAWRRAAQVLPAHWSARAIIARSAQFVRRKPFAAGRCAYDRNSAVRESLRQGNYGVRR